MVDDDEEMAGLVKYLLEQEQHSVRLAHTVSAGWKEIQDYTPDLIILDRNLPDDDGIEFCRELRTLKKHATTPVLMMSSMGRPTDVADSRPVTDDYIVKPFTIPELIARVKALLRRAYRPA